MPEARRDEDERAYALVLGVAVELREGLRGVAAGLALDADAVRDEEVDTVLRGEDELGGEGERRRTERLRNRGVELGFADEREPRMASDPEGDGPSQVGVSGIDRSPFRARGRGWLSAAHAEAHPLRRAAIHACQRVRVIACA